MKGSAVVELMAPVTLRFYAQLCGWTLARAHARSGDPVAIAEYLGTDDAFDQSIARLLRTLRRPEREGLRGNSSRRSGPGASRRPRVSEHPLSTVEVRWILPGQLDAAIAGWFRRFPGRTESREDAYLTYPVLRGLSVKLRAGRELEVKMCHGCPGILDAAGARGRLESWRKWSFPFGPLGPYDARPSAWSVVRRPAYQPIPASQRANRRGHPGSGHGAVVHGGACRGQLGQRGLVVPGI